MRKASLAESILSLATSSERAASVTGDLAERGIGFWPSVLSTALSLVVRDFLNSPLRIAGLTLGVFFAQFVLDALVSILHYLAFVRSAIRSTPGVFAFVLPVFLGLFLTQVLPGRWLSRLDRPHALAACIAVGALNLIVSLAWNFHMVSLPLVFWHIPFLCGLFIARPVNSGPLKRA